MRNQFRFNPTALVIIILLFSLEISFIRSVGANLFLILLGLIYLLINRVKLKTLGLMLLVSFPFALGTWLSFLLFSTNDNFHLAWIYTTRLYAYLLLGAAITLTIHVKELLSSLHQHLKLSNTFTYGLLAAFNLLPRVQQQVKTIHYAALIRGVEYHLWSPQLYFKSIVSALNWSTDLAEAMTSHGFSEEFPRTESVKDELPVWQPIVLMLLFIAANVVYFTFKPW
ncbi:MAG: energy-coupling factor transporter transmembrane protein EcfT [Lactobacillaceae bacterium]|jgi:energy-coupling factor transport system permease protein|nr:energy-coupling factor transporter transmembrane protein EcfT [Lactobacillaceae bacterium]